MRYDFRCNKCGNIFEETYTLTDLQYSFPTTQCPKCLAIAQRLFFPPAMILELQPYYDHGLGKYITTRQERKAEMKRLGLTEVGTERPDFTGKKKQKEIEKKHEAVKEEAMQIVSRLE